MQKTKKNVRIIPLKNYITFSIICLLTIALVFYLRNVYNNNKIKDNTIMSQFLVSLNEKEFENYSLEHPNSIIYLASSKDEKLSEFEEKFKELVIKIGLDNQMIFIDLDNLKDNEIKQIKNNYFSDKLSNINIGKYTNILIMENGKITSVLYNEKKDINIEDVKNFFSGKGLIGQQ